MLWLTVDKNGTEKLFKRYPERVGEYDSTWKGPDIYMPRVKEKTYWGVITSCSGEDYGAYIKLPTGSVYALTGKKLTWDDEPFEFIEVIKY